MLDVSAQAAASFASAGSHRGHFKAWALLHIPESSRAFRFSYPTLLAVATNSAYMWDIPKSELVSVIRDIQRQYLGSIMYVEVNDLYVFICGASGLQVFAREGGALLYQLSVRELSSATWDILPQTHGLASSIVQPQILFPSHQSPSLLQGRFMACLCPCSMSQVGVIDDVCFQVMYQHQEMISLLLQQMEDWSYFLDFSACFPVQLVPTTVTSPSF